MFGSPFFTVIWPLWIVRNNLRLTINSYCWSKSYFPSNSDWGLDLFTQQDYIFNYFTIVYRNESLTWPNLKNFLCS